MRGRRVEAHRSKLGTCALVVLAVAGLIVLATLPARAQQAAVNYVYDELGRLVAVINQQGDIAVYNYDAVGNLLSIERSNATEQPGAVAISLVSPNQGKVGTTVTIFGKGFSATPSQDALAFNGTAATVTEAAPNRLVATVPAGATTGFVTLAAPLGNATSPGVFTVLSLVGPLTVTPGTALMLPNRTQQFDALLNGSPTTSVTWAVNGIPGGDPAIGTISVSGLYTAPATQAGATSVAITARHVEDPLLTASATATVVVPRPLTTAGSAVVLPEPSVNIGLMVSASVQNAPAVTGASPASAMKGSTDVAVTLTGVGFTSATAVSFRLGNSVDSNITVSDLSVTSDTDLTISVDVASGAATGPRVIRVTTPAGESTVTGTGGNLFTVQ